MKLFKMIMLSMGVMCLTVSFAFAGGDAVRGKALLTDAKLLGMEKACASCHPNNEGWEKVGVEGRTEFKNCKGIFFLSLEDMIHVGIRQLGGKTIHPRSQEMQDIIAYLNSVAK